MKTTGKILILLLIVALLAGWLFYSELFPSGANEQKTAPPAKSGALFTVNAQTITPEVLNNNRRVTGSLIANESVILRSEVSARVESITFREGQKVKKGQLLIQLDNDDIVAEIEKLQFTKKLHEDNEYRQKQLLSKEAISQEEYEMALTTLNTTLADLKVKRVQWQKRRIVAPFDGIIGLRSVSAGSYINPSDELATVYSIDPIKIDFTVPGKYAADINIGDPLQFTADAYENKAFEGTIYAIEPQIDPQTRSINIRALSGNSERKLLPGQFVKISLTISRFEKAFMIPTEAVIPELNGKKVFIYKSGMVESRPVETGIRTADKIQVTSGLSQGDTLITTGILQLRAGTKVGLIMEDKL